MEEYYKLCAEMANLKGKYLNYDRLNNRIYEGTHNLTNEQKQTYYKAIILTNHIKNESVLIGEIYKDECAAIRKAFVSLKNSGLLVGKTYELVSKIDDSNPRDLLKCRIERDHPNKSKWTYERL